MDSKVTLTMMAHLQMALVLAGSLGLSAAVTPALPPTPPRDASDKYYTMYHFQPLKNCK